MKPIQVLLADDHAIVREGLRALLSLEKDVQVVGEACDGEEVVRLAAGLKPHVIVMDIGMPGANGIEATRNLVKAVPRARVIGLSIHKDRRFVLGMFSAGAKGYLLKHCAADELVLAIRHVHAGKVYVCEQVRGALADEYIHRIQGSPAASLLDLTSREQEVARRLSMGESSKQIAASLGVSPKTVESHRQHVMHKLGMNSIADLTRFAIREGLISADE